MLETLHCITSSDVFGSVHASELCFLVLLVVISKDVYTDILLPVKLLITESSPEVMQHFIYFTLLNSLHVIS